MSETTLYIVRLFGELEALREEARLSIDTTVSFLGVTRKTYIDWKYRRRIPNSKRELQFSRLTKLLIVAIDKKLLPEANAKNRRLVIKALHKRLKQF